MIEAVIISSVVPDLMHSLVSGIQKYLHQIPIVVGPGMKTGIRIVTANPREIGPDRIVDAVAAYELYGGPVLVIDFGTATTYDLVSEDGSFLAGITAPGIRTAARSLWEDAAKLPEFEIKKPESILAQETITSLQAGLVYGYVGSAEYIIRKVREESGFSDMKHHTEKKTDMARRRGVHIAVNIVLSLALAMGIFAFAFSYRQLQQSIRDERAASVEQLASLITGKVSQLRGNYLDKATQIAKTIEHSDAGSLADIAYLDSDTTRIALVGENGGFTTLDGSPLIVHAAKKPANSAGNGSGQIQKRFSRQDVPRHPHASQRHRGHEYGNASF